MELTDVEITRNKRSRNLDRFSVGKLRLKLSFERRRRNLEDKIKIYLRS